MVRSGTQGYACIRHRLHNNPSTDPRNSYTGGRTGREVDSTCPAAHGAQLLVLLYSVHDHACVHTPVEILHRYVHVLATIQPTFPRALRESSPLRRVAASERSPWPPASPDGGPVVVPARSLSVYPPPLALTARGVLAPRSDAGSSSPVTVAVPAQLLPTSSHAAEDGPERDQDRVRPRDWR